jgi:hypothetical protein
MGEAGLELEAAVMGSALSRRLSFGVRWGASEFRLGQTLIARSQVRYNRGGGAITIGNLNLPFAFGTALGDDIDVKGGLGLGGSARRPGRPAPWGQQRVILRT